MCILYESEELFKHVDPSLTFLQVAIVSFVCSLFTQVFINFAKNQMDSSVVEDNTSLVSSELSPLHRIKSKWRTWRRRVTFNKEMQFSRLMVMDREELHDSDGDEEEDESIDINFHEQRVRKSFANDTVVLCY